MWAFRSRLQLLPDNTKVIRVVPYHPPAIQEEIILSRLREEIADLPQDWVVGWPDKYGKFHLLGQVFHNPERNELLLIAAT
jgi:hypothetical protein